MAVNMFLGIGENLYEDEATLTALREAEANVANIAECAVKYLQFQKSNVFVMTNQPGVSVSMTPTYANIESFARGKIAEVERGALVIDTLLVYVAVHGFLNELLNKRYLCLRTTRTNDLTGTSLSYDLFWEWLLQFKARNTIVIGDVCQELTRTAGADRSDWVKSNEDEYDAMRVALKRSVYAPRTIGSRQTRPNQIRMDACGPGEFTYDGVYARYLTESIRQLAAQNSRVSIGQISSLTALKVAESNYGERCHPRYTIFEGCGDVSFQTGVVEPLRVTPTPPPIPTPAPTPSSVDALLDQAQKALDEKRYADAKKLAERALELDPDDPQAEFYLEEAKQGLDEEKELQKKVAEAVRLGWSAAKEARNDEQKWLDAFRYALDALKLESTNKRALALKNAVEQHAKEVELKNRRANIEKLLNEGVVLFNSNKWDAASAKADAILEVDPENEDALKLKDECQKKTTEQARAKKIAALLAEGEGLYKKGKFADARTKIDAIDRLEPNNAKACELRRQIEAADKKNRWIDCKPGEKRVLTIQNLPWTFIYCPPTGPNGFWMGSPENESGRYGDENRHKVILTKPAWLMDTVVTQAQYHSLMRPNGKCSFCASGDNSSEVSGMNTDNFPIERVSWDEFQELVKKLNAMKDQLGVPTEWRFSLPTEALWEYACRNFGESEGPYNAGSLDDCGWYSDNSGGRTHEVRKKKANKYGFYDFHGNVWEWVQDSWKEHLTKTETDPCRDKQGASRVYRGGSWNGDAQFCRAACRYYYSSDYRSDDLGARLALVLRQ